MLTKPKLIAQERFDLEDLNYFLSAIDNDQKAWTQQAWSSTAYILKGFGITTGIGTANVAIAGSTLVNPENTGTFSWYVGPSTATSMVASLTASTRNYLELQLYATDGTPLTRAFWDQTANNGAGSEFSQTTNTTTDLKIQINVNTSGFTGSANTLPLAFIDTDSGNNVKILMDRRNLFFSLALPSNPSNSYSWSNQTGIGPTLTLTGVSGTFVGGETATFSGGATGNVLTGGTTSIVVNSLSSTSFAIGNTVTGGTSGATGTLSLMIDPFTGADKNIGDLRTIISALETEIMSMKGTARWYYPTPASAAQILSQLNYAIASNASASTPKWTWTGTALSLTDGNGSPASGDVLAYIRIFGSSQVYSLQRQDGQASTSTLSISDGQVLYVQLGAASTSYSGVGSGSTNYQTISRANFVSNGTNFWIAYREGSSLFVRGGAQLDSGESQNVDAGDKVTLLANLGLVTDVTAPNYSSGTYGVTNGDIRGIAAEAVVKRVAKLTDAMGDAQEDRSAMLRSTQAVGWSGSAVSFTANLLLDVINSKSGTLYTSTITTANSPITLIDGDFAYVTVTRGTSANLVPVLNSVTPIPAQSQANKDVYVLFMRRGSDLLIPFHKQLILSGTTVKLGTSPGSAATRSYPTYFLSPAGNGDGTTFAAALAAIPAAGGVILLLDAITVTSTVNIPANVKLMGRDKNALITFGASGQLVLQGTEAIVEDVAFTSTQTSVTYVLVTGSNAILRNCSFTAPSATSGNTYVEVQANCSYLENLILHQTAAPDTNVGVQFDLGYTGAIYQNLKWTL